MLAIEMESSHCSLFESRLSSDWFDSFVYDKETDVSSLGINTHVFNKVIGTRRDGQTIELGFIPPMFSQLGATAALSVLWLDRVR